MKPHDSTMLLRITNGGSSQSKRCYPRSESYAHATAERPHPPSAYLAKRN